MDLVAEKLHIAFNNLMFTLKFLSDYWVYSLLSKTHLINKTSSIIIFHASLHAAETLNYRNMLGTEKRVFLFPCSVY